MPADWTEACSQTKDGGGSWIIADVAEGAGPGSASVPAWANVIENCYSYGRASVIGYVWTDYGEGGQASIAGIESQIDAWYSYYPGEIAGIFFDGVSDDVPGTSTSNQSFYRTLASYVHTHEGSDDEVVFNFGANPGSDWMLERQRHRKREHRRDLRGLLRHSRRKPLHLLDAGRLGGGLPGARLRRAHLQRARWRHRAAARFGVQLAGSAEHRLRLRRHLV